MRIFYFYNKSKRRSIKFEDGISLRNGETLDLSKFEGWDASNEDIVSIETGIVRLKKSGSVFLSNKIGEKVYIFELYVPANAVVYRMNTKIDSRDYQKVFVNQGHRGHDKRSSANGVLEDEINLKVAKGMLKQRGIDVQMSRTNDAYVSAQYINNI